MTTTITNADRIKQAHEALSVFTDGFPVYAFIPVPEGFSPVFPPAECPECQGSDQHTEENITDLIAGLLHLAAYRGLDADAILAGAAAHFRAGITGTEPDVEPGPDAVVFGPEASS